MRLDVYLVENQHFSSREQAKFNISKGNVLVNGNIALKPSQQIVQTDTVSLMHENAIPYVSRGGLKLEKALSVFGINCSGLDVIDIGASTGGFTDCALQHGAARVCAVDVGTNQLAEMLRENPKVTSMEGISIKDIDRGKLSPNKFHLLVTDLSFISLTKVMAYFTDLLLPQGSVVALIKPQFEVGREQVSKGGIVRNAKAHKMGIENVVEAARQFGLHLKGLTWAPIHSTSKNIEYLAHFVQTSCADTNIMHVVENAFADRNTMQKL
ncbi:MAG: TlyA family RNA methyltransferase [Bacteroidales bacterium]|nr:TlyA family RNA methyltransferase [Bacteroidales bacterium]